MDVCPAIHQDCDASALLPRVDATRLADILERACIIQLFDIIISTRYICKGVKYPSMF